MVICVYFVLVAAVVKLPAAVQAGLLSQHMVQTEIPIYCLITVFQLLNMSYVIYQQDTPNTPFGNIYCIYIEDICN